VSRFKYLDVLYISRRRQPQVGHMFAGVYPSSTNCVNASPGRGWNPVIWPFSEQLLWRRNSTRSGLIPIVLHDLFQQQKRGVEHNLCRVGGCSSPQSDEIRNLFLLPREHVHASMCWGLLPSPFDGINPCPNPNMRISQCTSSPAPSCFVTAPFFYPDVASTEAAIYAARSRELQHVQDFTKETDGGTRPRT
jgi:hypothetical protein